MHILIIPSWYKTPNDPIKGTFFEEQSRMLQREGHKVGILFPNHALNFLEITRRVIEKEPPAIIDEGLPTFYAYSESLIPRYGHPTKLDLWLLQRKAYKKFRDYVRVHGKPDILHAHSVFWGGIAARYISKKTEIPYFLTKHFTGWILSEKRKKSFMYSVSLVKTIQDSQKTFIVSSFYRDELLMNYPIDLQKITVLPNIVNPLFSESHTIIKHDLPTIITVIGYLKDRKNHLTLFKAIKLLKERGAKVELRVIGDGDMREKLEQFVKNKKLFDEIHFLGLLDRPEIVEQLKNTHILVSASSFETFGVNIIEALAMGRPVVALDSGGPRDILMDPGDGILIKENTPEAFVAAVEQVIAKYDTYDQEAISARCVDRFGGKTIYRQLVTYYQHWGNDTFENQKML